MDQRLLIQDSNYQESLLQPNQTVSFGTAIDDCSRHHLGINCKPGTQSFCALGHTFDLLHDEWKASLYITKPTNEDMKKCHVVEMTSPMLYDSVE